MVYIYMSANYIYIIYLHNCNLTSLFNVIQNLSQLNGDRSGYLHWWNPNRTLTTLFSSPYVPTTIKIATATATTSALAPTIPLLQPPLLVLVAVHVPV